MLMQNNQIRNLVRPTSLRKLLHDVVTSINTMRIREHKAHLLCELEELRARIAWSRDKDLWILDTRACIFVVDMRRRVYFADVINEISGCRDKGESIRTCSLTRWSSESTHHSAPHRKLSPVQALVLPFWARYVTAFHLQGHRAAASCVRKSGVPALLVTWRIRIHDVL